VSVFDQTARGGAGKVSSPIRDRDVKSAAALLDVLWESLADVLRTVGSLS
jgi:hypothetical protein